MTESLTLPTMRDEPAEQPLSEAPSFSTDIAFVRCVERLEELIDSETRILKSCSRIDFEALNLRKTHALLEFMRVTRNMPPQTSSIAQLRLADLVKRLGANKDVLEQHLHAMQEITALIVDSIRKDESDGTYSRKGASRR